MALQRKKVLLIDDDRDLRSAFKNFLESIGFSVTTSRDPKSAVAKLKRGKISILITDTNMPRLNGIELLKRVRADKELKKVTVVVLFSGLRNSAITSADVYKIGADYVWSKEQFIEKLSELRAIMKGDRT